MAQGMDTTDRMVYGHEAWILTDKSRYEGRVGQLVGEQRGIQLRGGDGQGLVIHRRKNIGGHVGKPGVHFRDAPEIPHDHIRGQRLAVGERGLGGQGDRPGQAVFAGLGLFRQQGLQGQVVADLEQRLGQTVDRGVPAVPVLVASIPSAVPTAKVTATSVTAEKIEVLAPIITREQTQRP